MSLGAENDLGRGLQESLQTANIFYDDLSRVYVEQTFSLKAHQVAGNEFAHGAELIRKLLMGCRKLKFNSASGLPALALSELE